MKVNCLVCGYYSAYLIPLPLACSDILVDMLNIGRQNRTKIGWYFVIVAMATERVCFRDNDHQKCSFFNKFFFICELSLVLCVRSVAIGE